MQRSFSRRTLITNGFVFAAIVPTLGIVASNGDAGDANGGCKIFPGKQVAAGAYCKSWAKKS